MGAVLRDGSGQAGPRRSGSRRFRRGPECQERDLNFLDRPLRCGRVAATDDMRGRSEPIRATRRAIAVSGWPGSNPVCGRRFSRPRIAILQPPGWYDSRPFSVKRSRRPAELGALPVRTARAREPRKRGRRACANEPARAACSVPPTEPRGSAIDGARESRDYSRATRATPQRPRSEWPHRALAQTGGHMRRATPSLRGGAGAALLRLASPDARAGARRETWHHLRGDSREGSHPGGYRRVRVAQPGRLTRPTSSSPATSRGCGDADAARA